MGYFLDQVAAGVKCGLASREEEPVMVTWVVKGWGSRYLDSFLGEWRVGGTGTIRDVVEKHRRAWGRQQKSGL